MEGKCDRGDDEEEGVALAADDGSRLKRNVSEGEGDVGAVDIGDEFVDLCGAIAGDDTTTCDVMGIDASAPKRGEERTKLFLKTGSQAPFCLGRNGVVVKRSNKP